MYANPGGIAELLSGCAGLAWAQPENPNTTGDVGSLEAGDPIPGSYIVVFKDLVDDPAATARSLFSRLDLTTERVCKAATKGFSAEVPEGELRADKSGQKVPTGIKRIAADKSGARAGAGDGRVKADIAILDSGIYRGHEDLNVAGGVNCVGDDKSNWSDPTGHGTHVAGTAAAKDNKIGVVGVAPGRPRSRWPT